MIRFATRLAGVAAVLAPQFSALLQRRRRPRIDRPVKIIVPIGPGGSYDLVGRHLADALSKHTGQAFFVENKPGAGTVVGTQVAARANPMLYVAGRRALQHGLQFGAVFEARLRPAQGFVSGRTGLQVGYVMSSQGYAADEAAGHRRGCESQSGLDHVATAGVGTGQNW